MDQTASAYYDIIGIEKGELISMDIDLGLSQPSDLPRIYSIMEEAFPPAETISYKVFERLYHNPKYKVLAIKNKLGMLSGFLSWWKLDGFNFAEYFAIRKNMRGRGLGSVVLNKFLRRTKKPVVLEVEAFDTNTAKRRIKFYQRLGFKLNDITYIQPPLNKSNEQIPLTIMSYPELIPQAKRQSVIDQIFTNVYKKVPA